MRLSLKIIAATTCWTAAIGAALGFTLTDSDPLMMWATLTVAVAVLLSAALAGDYIAAEAAKYIVGRVASERAATVTRAIKLMDDAARAREDRLVSRIQASNEATLRRVAGEIARAMQEDARPTPIR